VLICYTTAGAGHRRAAEALAEAARERFPHAEVRCVDVLTHTPGWFQRWYPRMYLATVRHLPTLWGLGYRLLDTAGGFWCVRGYRRMWNLLMATALGGVLKTQHPDLVIATHFLPGDVCGALKASGRLRAALAIVVTDWHPHRFWTCPEAEAVVVGSEEAERTLVQRGVSRERVHVLGIPIGKAFRDPGDPAACRRRLGLSDARRTILVTSGGTTVGRFEQVVQALMRLETRHPGMLQLIVVCGEDEPTRERLSLACLSPSGDGRQAARRAAMPVRVLGFVENMAELMASSDVVVAKAGGLTLSEALGRGTPLIIYHAIPGQERVNAAAVARQGAAIIAGGPRGTAAAVARVLQDPERLAGMRRAALALARPDAAAAIVERVMQPLLQTGDR
jgi:processive 1,2-diacylglycerol beta-glucosyltransferase